MQTGAAHPCRYTYPAFTHRIQPFQDFDTGGAHKNSTSTFLAHLILPIRYFTLFHGKHLRIFIRHVYNVFSANCADKDLRLRGFKRLASSPRRARQVFRGKIIHQVQAQRRRRG